MPNSERDSFFVALTQLGYDANTTNKDQLEAAAQLLKEQNKKNLKNIVSITKRKIISELLFVYIRA